jgi:hypothetical protein
MYPGVPKVEISNFHYLHLFFMDGTDGPEQLFWGNGNLLKIRGGGRGRAPKVILGCGYSPF